MINCSTINFVHFSDIHLGSSFRFLNEKAEQHRGDLRRVLTNVVDMILNNVSAIQIAFLTGDMFDKHNPELVDRVHAFSEIERLAESGIRVYVLPGTHDSISYPSSVWNQNRLEDVHVIRRSDFGIVDKFEMKGNNVEVFSMVWNPLCPVIDLPDIKRSNEKGISFGMLHASWIPGAKWDVKPREIVLDPAKVDKLDLDYLALGHFHNFSRYKIGKTVAAYPGTPEGLKFDETGDRYVIFGQASLEKGVVLEKRPVNIREMRKIDIDLSKTGIDSHDELENRIRRQSGKDVIAKVIIKGRSFEGYNQEILKESLKNNFFFLEIEDRSTVENGEWLGAISKENTVRGFFVNKLLNILESDPDNEIAQEALKIGMDLFQKT